MGVIRLPDPGMLPTSQEGGGTVHSNSLAQTAPGTQPGYDGGLMTYPVSTDSPAPMSPNQDDRNRIQASGSPGPQDAPFAQAAAFAESVTSTNAAKWKPTPSS